MTMRSYSDLNAIEEYTVDLIWFARKSLKVIFERNDTTFLNMFNLGDKGWRVEWRVKVRRDKESSYNVNTIVQISDD